jgi:DNA-binding beta-propeller fold protein YncE
MSISLRLRRVAGCVAALAVCTALSAAGYHLLNKISVPGDYGWDYAAADTEGRRLYVGHERELVVLDLDTGAIVGSVGGGTDMHGAAVARAFGRGFISQSNPDSGSVVIFDLKTLARIGEVTVGRDPNLIMFDRKTGRIFTADRGDQRVTAIDAKTGKVVGKVENLGGRTEHGVSDEKGHMFLNMQDKGLVHRIDAQALKVLDTWPVAPCAQPSSMDMDKTHDRLFIGCRSGVMAVVNATTGKVITTMPIGPGVDATEFDAATGLIYFSSGGEGGSLSIFHEDTPDVYSFVERVTTQANARTLAVDHKTGRVYLPVGQFAPAPAGARGRGPMVPGSFAVLVFGK